MKGYTKDNVQIDYHDHYSRNPAVNVKAYDFPNIWSPQIRVAFPNASDETLENALEYAFQSAQLSFWDRVREADELAYYFPDHNAKVHQAGRSGGWLVVSGLPDVETWNAIMLNRWAVFERDMRNEVKYLCSPAAVIEAIEVNRWAEDGAQQYNFIDTRQGVVCFADLHKTTHEYPAVIASTECAIRED